MKICKNMQTHIICKFAHNMQICTNMQICNIKYAFLECFCDKTNYFNPIFQSAF